MDKNYYIRLILTKSTEFHNRCNDAIEEIIRGRDEQETIKKLVDSIKYSTEDILRIIGR